MDPIRLLIADDHQMVRDGLRRLLEREPDLTVVGETGAVQETLDAAQQLQPDVLLLDLRLADGSGRAVIAALPKQPRLIRVIAMTGHPQEEGSLPRFGRGADMGGVAEELIGLGASGYLVKTASAQELILAIRAVHDGEIWADHGTLSRLVVHLQTGSTATGSRVPGGHHDPERREGAGSRCRNGRGARGEPGDCPVHGQLPDHAHTRPPTLRAGARPPDTRRSTASSDDHVPLTTSLWTRRSMAEDRRTMSGLLSAREREILQEVGSGYNNSEIAQRLYISENTVKAHLSRIFQKLMVTDRTQAVVIGLQCGLITPVDVLRGS